MTKTIKENVIWINSYLSVVYEREMRLSSLLSNVGFESTQIKELREENLELLVSSYMKLIEQKLLDYYDGERLFRILSRRAGLDGTAIETLQSLGKELAISRERVRQLETKALRRCRHKVHKEFLESTLRELAHGLLE